MGAVGRLNCERCGKRLRKGGDNFILDASLISDFDGYLDIFAENLSPEELVEQIEDSGLTERELEEQVHYHLRQKICQECRNSIISFLKGHDVDE